MHPGIVCEGFPALTAPLSGELASTASSPREMEADGVFGCLFVLTSQYADTTKQGVSS
jgi:hypothetical protein